MAEPSAAPVEETRIRSIGGSFRSTEELEVLEAFADAGLTNKSRATRIILFAFARDEQTRAAVLAFLQRNLVLLAD